MSPFSVTFDRVGDFAAHGDAERALRAEGFAIGPTQSGAPQAVMFGNYAVSKWRNLNQDERRETHATLTGDVRNGPMIFRLLPAAPDDAVRAAEAIRRSATGTAQATGPVSEVSQPTDASNASGRK